MKSFIEAFASLYNALIQDIIAWCPSIKPDMERDLSRLHNSVANEGLSFLTITHVAMEKAFLKALSGEVSLHSCTGRLRGLGAKGVDDVRPKYLHGLWSHIFTSDGTLRSDADPDAIFFLRQWLSFAKKVEMDCTDERTFLAVSDWIRIDNNLPDHWKDTWDSDVPCWSRHSGHPLYGGNTNDENQLSFLPDCSPSADFDWDGYSMLCACIATTLGYIDTWALRPKHGPGAVADRGGLKYEFLHWPAKLQSIFPWDFFASTDFGLYERGSGREPTLREFPSVMHAVPKTQLAPRLIAAEPIAHQWIQGGIQRWLEERVNDSWIGNFIDFRDQSASQKLVTWASVNSELATVDLSAASDRLSSRLVEYTFQANQSLLDALHACRSRLVRLPSGEAHRMRKFAPMGSSVCFPIQTIVFLSLAIHAVSITDSVGYKDVVKNYRGRIRVFGDDIILPSTAYPALQKLLGSLGLVVNESKSFSTGHFRESCGKDCYRGYDVTPVRPRKFYSESDPSSLEAVVQSSNNLFLRGLWNCSAALLKTIPPAILHCIPVGAYDGGAVSLVSFLPGHDPIRLEWDSDLQRDVTRSMTVSTRQVMRRSDGNAGLRQFFFEEPSPDEHFTSGQVIRSIPRKRVRKVGLIH